MGTLYRKIKKMIFDRPNIDYLTKQNWASALIVLKDEELEMVEDKLTAAMQKTANPIEQIKENEQKIALLEKFQKETLSPIFKKEEAKSEQDEEAFEEDIDQLLDEI